jgi:TonB family protein
MSSAPITTNRPSGKNHHRRSPRQRIDTLMYVGLGHENGGFPTNVSEGGMAFQGIQALEKNQLVHINFKLPGSRDSVESAARIAWLNVLGKGGGLRFIDLPEATRRVINEWLSLQTSSCGVAEDAPILGTQIETSPLSPVATTKAITTGDPTAIPIHSVKTSRNLGFRDPNFETKKRNTWNTQFSLGVITSLVSTAILAVISFQLHGGLQLPTMNGNPMQPASESVAATAPPNTSEIQAADAQPSEPIDSGLPASPAARSAVDTIGPSDQPATPALKAPVSRPAKMAMPLKFIPPRTLSQQMAANANHVLPSVKMKSPAADVAPPALLLPTNPALPPQLPALLPEMRPPAPSPRESVQRSSKFDAAQLIARQNPVYPKVARAIGLSGAVELHFIVGADGSVRNATVVKGNPLLARAAVDAIYAWHFQPARRDGVPVETESGAVFVFKPN